MEKPNRREREKIARKNDIMTAACQVFAQKGYYRATLDEIAEKAEFSKATIYAYFKNKADLFFRLIIDGLSELTQLVENTMKDKTDFKTLLKNIVHEIFDYLDKNRDFFTLLYEQRIELHREISSIENNGSYEEEFQSTAQKLDDSFERLFQKAAENKQIDGNIPPRLLTSIMLGSIFGIIRVWLERMPHEPLADKTDIIIKVFWEGAGV